LFYKHFTKFETNHILFNKISPKFLLTTKLFSGWKNFYFAPTNFNF